MFAFLGLYRMVKKNMAETFPFLALLLVYSLTYYFVLADPHLRAPIGPVLFALSVFALSLLRLPDWILHRQNARMQT